MELVAIASVLWARRVVLGLGLLVAVAVGVVLIGISRGSAATWVASAQVLIDTKDSQLVNVAPQGVGVVSMRALLTADLMSSDAMKTLISREAGVPANQLEILGPWSRGAPEVLTPLVMKTAKYSTLASDRYVLSLYADGQSSIISIDANAPDATRAATLARAATNVLKSSLASGEPGTLQKLVLDTLAPPTATVVPGHSRRRLFALIGSLATFVVWCGVVVLAAGIGGRARRAQPA